MTVKAISTARSQPTTECMPIKSLGFGTRPKSSAKSSPGFRKNGRKPAPPKIEQPADTSDLAGLSPEQIVKQAAPEAIAAIVSIMRKPGRHAATQLRAAEMLMRYGVQEPAKATTVSAPGGGPIQSKHEIVFVRPGEIPEDLK